MLLPDGSKIVNNHFTDNSLLSVRIDHVLVEGTRHCLDIFFHVSGRVVSERKIDFWVVGIDDLVAWIPSLLKYIRLGVIMLYLGISFGTRLLVVAMWDWCLYKLQTKILMWQFKDLPFVGKLTFVSWILQALHIYYVSC